MSKKLEVTKHGFGTLPVFLTTISTILGAILFLRFGYAVGNVGFWGTMAIIVMGHIVTIATGMAVSEIATNQRVEGGGAYFIISRSFGLNIGASIGIALFLAQAISVAFYVIAFAEAFDPVIAWMETFGYTIPDKRMISIPAMGLLTLIVILKGADLGIKSLYVVCTILFVSILLFFLGNHSYEAPADRFLKTVSNPDPFFYVFTIIFPAFTGIAAGLGLSGDLKDPKKSLPLGTLSATGFGMIVYVFIALKLTNNASPAELATDQFVMSKISAWGPAIPLGLAAATISSALGSILIAPRTLQALGADNIFPLQKSNEWFAKQVGSKSEPYNAYVITCIIAFFFIVIGDVNFVAEIISMFFMVTYGAICLVSFLEHIAANPAYRPTFKSKWYISLIGAVACFWLMFQMNFVYAWISIALMVGIYVSITYFSNEKRALSQIFQGVIFQTNRQIKLYLQKIQKEGADNNLSWRPSVVCISEHFFDRLGAFEMLTWISDKYGFGTYIQHITGYLSKDSREKSKETLKLILDVATKSKSKVYFDTIISPSITTAIAQVMQLPGISGHENNALLFEFPENREDESLEEIIKNYNLIKAMEFDVLILRTTERGFGFHKQIHIWITSRDYENANLMILLGFIILGHDDWDGGEIKLFTIFPEDEMEERRNELKSKLEDGRLPISKHNIEIISRTEDVHAKELIKQKSAEADLTIIGFRNEMIKQLKSNVFKRFGGIGNTLFVNTNSEIDIE